MWTTASSLESDNDDNDNDNSNNNSSSSHLLSTMCQLLS